VSSDLLQIDDNADAALENEMHRGCRFALLGDDVAGLNFEASASQAIGELHPSAPRGIFDCWICC